MSTFVHVRRDEKRRIALEIRDNLAERAANGSPDGILDPFISKSAAVGDALAIQIEEKSAASAERTALLAENDADDDEVDRWYRHTFRYLEVESMRRHAPDHVAIVGLLTTAYPDGLEHVAARVPDENEEVRKALVVLGNPENAGTLAAIAFPTAWLEALDLAVKKSEASFEAYQAAIGDKSSAVAMGRDTEDDWVQWARAITHAIALRSSGANIEVVEEGKRLIAPLTNAVKQLRSEARARATRKKNAPTP